MSKIFVIADTHFGHTNILSYCRSRFKTIEEHDEHIIQMWNSVVTPRDKVYHLGDFQVSTSKHLFRHYASRLNGKKRLIMGNHDKLPVEVYREFFDKVMATRQLGSLLLSHMPVKEDYKSRWKINIHGHTHETIVSGPYANVCCEHLDYIPKEINLVHN